MEDLINERRISTFHIDRPAVTLTLERYYPGNQAEPPLRLMCNTSTYFRLNLHGVHDQGNACSTDGRVHVCALPAAGLQAQQVSPPHRAVTEPEPQSLSPRRILICSGCSVIEADGARRRGPTWRHFSSYLSIYLPNYLSILLLLRLLYSTYMQAAHMYIPTCYSVFCLQSQYIDR